jgi:hypothetical protein
MGKFTERRISFADMSVTNRQRRRRPAISNLIRQAAKEVA